MKNKELLSFIAILVMVICNSLSVNAEVGDTFTCSTEDGEILFTVTGEDQNTVELSKYIYNNTSKNSILEIPRSVVNNQNNIEYIVTSVGESACEGTPSEFRGLKLPDTVKVLGSYAFQNSHFIVLDLRHVEEIGENCFFYENLLLIPFVSGSLEGYYEPGPLKKVILGSALRKIGSLAFKGQRLIDEVLTYSLTCPIFDNNKSPFEILNCSNVGGRYIATLYVPSGTEKYYQEEFVEKYDRNFIVKPFLEDRVLNAVIETNRTRYQDFYMTDYHAGTDTSFYYEYQYIRDPLYEIPCTAAWALCKVDNEYLYDIEPSSIEWSVEDPSVAEITQDGVYMGIRSAKTHIFCDVTIDGTTGRFIHPISFLYKKLGEPYNKIEEIEGEVFSDRKVIDLQGREIKGDILNHGVYIVKEGEKTSKVII